MNIMFLICTIWYKGHTFFCDTVQGNQKVCQSLGLCSIGDMKLVEGLFWFPSFLPGNERQIILKMLQQIQQTLFKMSRLVHKEIPRYPNEKGVEQIEAAAWSDKQALKSLFPPSTYLDTGNLRAI